MKKILVTRPYLPPIERYKTYVDGIWHNHHLTNHGPYLNELEGRLRDIIGNPYVHFVTNGTLALQLALRGLDVTEGEVITTPFSYVATTSTILWERCTPVFVDIDPETFCLDPAKVEAAITPQTRAIMAVHVFGYPCDVDALQDIAARHNLKLIYDGAHAFGCRYRGRSLLDYGDIATCSFHATKVFHTIEGGCVVSHSKENHDKLFLQRSFGHIGDEHFELGINAKGSEFQAVMGLCNLQDFEGILARRRGFAELYDNALPLEKLGRPRVPTDFVYNYGYYPVVFDSPERCTAAIAALQAKGIFPRRYFFPSLNTLPYLKETQSCPVSESIALRIICLPFWGEMDEEIITDVASVLKEVV